MSGEALFLKNKPHISFKPESLSINLHLRNCKFQIVLKIGIGMCSVYKKKENMRFDFCIQD